LTGSYTYDDGSETLVNGTHVDFFEREPYVVSFSSANTGNIHEQNVKHVLLNQLREKVFFIM